MSKFFIYRPIVAIVIAIFTVIVGAATIAQLPVAQFPQIAPPRYRLRALMSERTPRPSSSPSQRRSSSR
jgi:multidrug efflux pump subunit AcrB